MNSDKLTEAISKVAVLREMAKELVKIYNEFPDFIYVSTLTSATSLVENADDLIVLLSRLKHVIDVLTEPRYGAMIYLYPDAHIVTSMTYEELLEKVIAPLRAEYGCYAKLDAEGSGLTVKLYHDPALTDPWDMYFTCNTGDACRIVVEPAETKIEYSKYVLKCT